MQASPMLVLHICGGTVGLLSGAVAMTFRKGSRGHVMAGKVFFVSMLCLSLSGVYMALVKDQPGNVLGGSLTFYLLVTAWMTARRRTMGTDIFDWGALLAGLAIGAVGVTYTVEAATSPTGLSHGYPAGPYVLLGSLALLGAVGDVRLLVRGGIAGTHRIARHLWRMCIALFIAAMSVFTARQQLFPAVLRRTGALYFLSLLPLLLMIFWLIRVRFKNAYVGQPSRSTGEAYSAQVRNAQAIYMK